MKYTYSKVTRYRKQLVFKRDFCVCQYCGKIPVRVDFVKSSGYGFFLRLIDPDSPFPFEVDHVMPSSKGGSNKIENLKTSCWRCNNKKRDKIYG